VVRNNRNRKTLQTLLTLAAAGVSGVVAWATLVERTRWMLREVSLPVLPGPAAPLRVLHLSDLHMAPWQRSKQEWLRQLAVLTPDLVINTGDNLGHPHGVIGLRRALEPFAGVPGVFVNGSNDYFAPVPKNPLGYFAAPSKLVRNTPRLDTDELVGFFGELGWINLNNSAATLELRGTEVELFGVDDPHKDYDRLDLMATALDDLRADDPHGDDAWPHEAEALHRPQPAISIGVAHAPYQRILNSFITYGAELIFAGHTHGGQICLPGVGALVTNCDIPRSQAKGVSLWHHGPNTAWLSVSAGLGTSIYAPARFACRPEASLVTLVPTE